MPRWGADDLSARFRSERLARQHRPRRVDARRDTSGGALGRLFAGVDAPWMGTRAYMTLLLLFLLPLGLALVLLTTTEPHKHGRHRHTR